MSLHPRRFLAAAAVVGAAALASAGAAGAAGWLPAEQLSPGDLQGISPSVVVDEDGDAFAIWNVSGGVQATERQAGADWAVPSVIEAQNTAFSHLAITPGGTLVAAGTRPLDSDQQRIRSRVRPPGGTWSAPQEGPPFHGGGLQGFAVTSEGAALALQDRSTWFRPSGGEWGPTEAIPGAIGGVTPYGPRPSHLAMDRHGNAVAVWSAFLCTLSPGPGFFDCVERGVQAATRPAGGTWTEAQTIFSPPATAIGAAVLSSGDALVLFQGSDALLMAYRAPGEAWSLPEPVPAPIPLRNVAVGVDAADNLLVVWSRNFAIVDEETGQSILGTRVEAATRAPDGTWGARDVLAQLPGAPARGLQVAVGARGGAIAAWEQAEGSGDARVTAVVRSAGGTWGAPATLMPEAREISGLRVAVNADSDGVVVWQQDEAVGAGIPSWRVRAAVHEGAREAGPPPIPAAPTPDPPGSIPRCLGLATAPAATGDDRAVALSAAQLRVNQRIGQAAIRRLNAVEAWLEAGIQARDLCGGAIGASKLAGGIVSSEAPSDLAEPSIPEPRPVVVAPAGEEGGQVRLSAEQLQINQRIYQAAIRRAEGLEKRLAGRLTGAELAAGALTQEKLHPRLRILSAAQAAFEPAPSRTHIAGRRAGAGDAIRLSAAQLRINQRIAQAAVRRANALVARLEAGLTGEAFADRSITARNLASGVVRP